MNKILKTIRKALRFFRYDPSIIFNKLGIAKFSHEEGLFSYFARRYYKKSGLDDLFIKLGQLNENEEYKLFISGHKVWDITNLHRTILNGEHKQIIEFGSGTSTIAMAHALKLLSVKLNGSDLRLFAVEPDAKWAEIVSESLKKLNLNQFVEVITSEPKLTNYDNQVVSFFETLPDISPDLIYLDGPDPRSVTGNINGLTMTGLNYIIQGDILKYEWSFFARAKIIIDGRDNNLKFLKKNLKRKYSFRKNYTRNVNTIELIS